MFCPLFVYVHAHRATNHVNVQSHKDLAREAVRKSLVLLKNGNDSSSPPLLPLSKAAPKILVAGSHAADVGLQCGGWSISWQGDAGNNQTQGKKISNQRVFLIKYNVDLDSSYSRMWLKHNVA